MGRFRRHDRHPEGMDDRYVSAELGVLVEDLDGRLDAMLAQCASCLVDDLDRNIRPLESLIDDLYFDQRIDDRSARVARDAIDGLRAICDRLPTTLQASVDSSAYDRLRALSTDLRLES